MGIIHTKCPHCGGDAGMQIFALQPDHKTTFRHTAGISAAATCPICRNPICARLQIDLHKIGMPPNRYAQANYIDDLIADFDNADTTPEAFGIEVVDIWPKLPDPDIPRHLPDAIEAKLLDAERSFHAHINTGAVSLYRSVIDLTAKSQLEEADLGTSGPLYVRLQKLGLNHVIPRAVGNWANEVRAIRNEMLHEESIIPDDDVAMIRSFALTYLRYAFELPGDVAEQKELALAIRSAAA